MSDNLSKEKGDFHKFHRPSAGSRTVEGNTSGARAMRLEQQRQQDQAEFESRKQQAERASASFLQQGSGDGGVENPYNNNAASLNIRSKFQQARIGSVEEQSFRAKTVGLVTAEEFAKATNEKENGNKNDRDNLTPEEQALEEQKQARQAKKEAKKRKRKRKEKKQRAALLSFGGDDEDDDDNDDNDSNDDNDNNDNGVDNNNNNNNDTKTTKNSTDADATQTTADAEHQHQHQHNHHKPPKKQKASKKDPSIDTSFLPDKDREDAFIAQRIRLETEWKESQERIRSEKLQITYSYWDGSGHRRTCTIRKGDSVGDGFLEVVRKDLSREFRELKNVACDALLYVKEDLILPHDITFYDLIATKARGKSGPLFRFDIKDDIRTGAIDVRVEKDESHPGKVVERSWYEKNKHIFPASRWELYDPSKNYGGYTIAGKIVTTKDNKNSVFA